MCIIIWSPKSAARFFAVVDGEHVTWTCHRDKATKMRWVWAIRLKSLLSGGNYLGIDKA